VQQICRTNRPPLERRAVEQTESIDKRAGFAVIAEIFMGAGAATAAGLTYLRTRRVKLYRELAVRVAAINSANSANSARSFDIGAMPERHLPRFTDGLAVTSGFLPGDAIAALRQAAQRVLAPERSFVPTHKKGGTVAYETLIAAAPEMVSCYHSPDLIAYLSRLVGVSVQPTPIWDQSSLSLLVYDKPGDHIGWHYDHNFYRGRHFTVLLAIDNEGTAPGGLSHAVLKGRVGGREIEIGTAPNTIVVFEGALLHHKVTPLLQGERRLVLSMTYCTDPRSRWWQAASRRFKDTAFFGIRALWT
jgi:hypothetical protein